MAVPGRLCLKRRVPALIRHPSIIASTYCYPASLLFPRDCRILCDKTIARVGIWRVRCRRWHTSAARAFYFASVDCWQRLISACDERRIFGEFGFERDRIAIFVPDHLGSESDAELRAILEPRFAEFVDTLERGVLNR